jgi:hypothetical protein
MFQVKTSFCTLLELGKRPRTHASFRGAAALTRNQRQSLSSSNFSTAGSWKVRIGLPAFLEQVEALLERALLFSCRNYASMPAI